MWHVDEYAYSIIQSVGSSTIFLHFNSSFFSTIRNKHALLERKEYKGNLKHVTYTVIQFYFLSASA